MTFPMVVMEHGGLGGSMPYLERFSRYTRVCLIAGRMGCDKRRGLHFSHYCIYSVEDVGGVDGWSVADREGGVYYR